MGEKASGFDLEAFEVRLAKAEQRAAELKARAGQAADEIARRSAERESVAVAPRADNPPAPLKRPHLR